MPRLIKPKVSAGIPDVSSLPPIDGVNACRSATYKAYQYWSANKHLSIVDAACKMGCEPVSLRDFVERHKLPRFDGKTVEKKQEKSNRQLTIEKGYKMAVKKGWTARQAALWVIEQTGQTCTRGDVQYWAMKNDLPYLPEASTQSNQVK